MQKRFLIIILVLLVAFPSLCLASSEPVSIEKNRPDLQSSVNNVYCAKLISETYVSLLKEKFVANTEDTLFQEAKFKYQIARIKFTVWQSMLELIYDEKHKLSLADNEQISSIGSDALLAYEDFIVAAQKALNNSAYTLTLSKGTGNITARNVTQLTVVDVATIATDTVSDETALVNAIKDAVSGKLTTSEYAFAIKAVGTAFKKYGALKTGKTDLFKIWLKENCTWQPW